MEKEKPYQPTDEEIQRAEDTMTEKQKLATSTREKIYNKGLREDIHVDISKMDWYILHYIEMPGSGRDIEGAIEALDDDARYVDTQIEKLETAKNFLLRKRQELVAIKESQKGNN